MGAEEGLAEVFGGPLSGEEESELDDELLEAAGAEDGGVWANETQAQKKAVKLNNFKNCISGFACYEL